MKIRFKFTKEGPLRYVGHLDFMRSFQKGIKKSGLPAVYSSGFNPHMLMSFAAPLAIGEETLGDYVDVDFAFRDRFLIDSQEAYRLQDLGLDNDALPDPPPAADLCRILTESMPEGVRVLDAVRVGLTKGSKAMALVRYASWKLAPICDSPLSLNADDAERYMARESIPYLKKTKSGERTIDIRPMILKFFMDEGGTLCLTCASGSSVNLKCSAVLETFAADLGKEYEAFSYRGIRQNLYDADMVPLIKLGNSF